MSVFYDIINPFTVNIGAVYLQYQLLFDPIIAFILFLSLCSFVFRKKYGDGREGKAVAIAVALALTFAFAVFELATGFSFGHPIMQGLAGLILLLVFGILLYELLNMMFGDHHKMCALAITYFIIYGVLMGAFSPLYQHIRAYSDIVWAVLGIGFIISIIATIMCFIRMITGLPSSGGHDNGGHGGGSHGSGNHGQHGQAGQGGGGHAPQQHTQSPDIHVRMLGLTNGQHFAQGVPVTAVAEIQGGSGNHEWLWEPHANTNNARGHGSQHHVQAIFNGLPPGRHVISVAVVDTHDPTNHDGARVEIIVDPHTTPPQNVGQLHARVQAYHTHVQQFATQVQQYRLAGGNLLRTMQEVFQGTETVANLRAAMQAFIQIGNTVAHTLHQVRDEVRAIIRDPGFRAMPQPDVHLFAQAHRQYFIAAISLADYQHTFQNDYNNIRP